MAGAYGLFQRISVVLLFSAIILSVSLQGEEMNTLTVRGLFYRDGITVLIQIRDGRISNISRQEPSEEDRNLPFVAPGLIDIQVNGYLSVDFSEPGLTVEGIRKATQGLWKVGVTTYLPTVVTSPYEVLKENFAVLARALNDPDIACSIPGFHLEGPYISPVDGFRGAHYKPFVRPPDWEEFVKINRAAGDRIMEVSLAPEVEGAMEFIRKCAQHGILVGLAHHNGSAEQIREAVDLGAVISTHLGNGCANTIHRHNNPLWPQLADDRLMASVIVDGFHLTGDEVRTFFKVKGKDRLILTSDVTNLAGMPPGEYQFNEQKVVMTPDGMIRNPEQNVLAGASLPVVRGMANVMRFTGCSLGEAIDMASRNPARLFGLKDRGELQAGKRGDLILFRMEDGKITIESTIIEGKTVYQVKNR